MTYTSHGHHIPDSTKEDEVDPPKRLARCGGPGLCATCSSESGKWAEQALMDKVIEDLKMTGERGHKTIVQAARYQTQPIEVIAVRYNGGVDGLDIQNWIRSHGRNATWNDYQPPLTEPDGHIHPAINESFMLETGWGWVEVPPGSWIVQDDSNWFWIYSPERFEQTYTPKE